MTAPVLSRNRQFVQANRHENDWVIFAGTRGPIVAGKVEVHRVGTGLSPR